MTENKSEIIDLDILGMSCVNCARNIQTYISKLSGINSISLNFGAEVAHIDYCPDVISLDEIKAATERLQNVAHSLAQFMYQGAGAQPGAGEGAQAEAGAKKDGDDTIDADFKEV